MQIKKTIGFIGAGNMAEALIKGLLSSKASTASRITASDANKERLAHVADAFGIKALSKNFEAAKNSDIIMLAVKPGDLGRVLDEITAELDSSKVLISIAAGKKTDWIAARLAHAGLKRPVKIIRAMPNTPALVGSGVTGLFAADGAEKEAQKTAAAIFSAVGSAVFVPKESLLDAVTGLSGSGPAYVFLFMEALMEAGEKEGLSRKIAATLAIETTLGAARLALAMHAGETGHKTLKDLIRAVSSPGGTTIEGLKKFEEAGLKEIVGRAVSAASKRAKELSEAG